MTASLLVAAIAVLSELAEENAALKAEVESWRILSETHEECGEEWAGRALKAEAELVSVKEQFDKFSQGVQRLMCELADKPRGTECNHER